MKPRPRPPLVPRPEVTEHHVEVTKWAAEEYFTCAAMEHFETEAARKGVKMRLQERILQAMQQGQSETIKRERIYVYETLWNMFKGKYFPRWLEKWFPAKFTTYYRQIINNMHYNLCPHIAVDESTAHLNFLVYGARHDNEQD